MDTSLASGTMFIYLLAGACVGALLMMLGFVHVIRSFLKVRKSNAAVPMIMGGLTILICQSLMFVFQHVNNFAIGMLLFSGVFFGYAVGLSSLNAHLEQPPPSKKLLWLAGGFLMVYAILLWNEAAFDIRFRLLSTAAVIFWPIFALSLVKSSFGRYRLAKNWMLAGAIIIFLCQLARLFGLHNVEIFAGTALQAVFPKAQAVLFGISFIGGALFAFGFIVIYFERVLEQSTYTANHDELTGLLNRRAINAQSERALEMAQNAGGSLTVVFADIDHFKKINDQFGHEQGDLVLHEVAKILAGASGSGNLIGRYGGEEFCLVFPGADLAGAEAVAQGLIEAVRRHQFGDLPPVTISMGLAVMSEGALPVSWHGLVKLADLQLYRAKRQGRDQFCIAAAEHGPRGQENQPALPFLASEG